MKLFKRTSKKLSVEEAKDKLYNEISKNINWKLVKSQKFIKKVVGELVFEIHFYSSKWNESYKNIEIQCECQLWCRKFDKVLNVKSQVGYYKFSQGNEEWWNITDERELSNTIEQLCRQINATIIPLSNAFETDFLNTSKKLAEEDLFNTYNIRFEFIYAYAGREYILLPAKKYFDSLSETMKQEVIQYREGARNKAWMINPSNLKYIIDNDIVRDAFIQEGLICPKE